MKVLPKLKVSKQISTGFIDNHSRKAPIGDRILAFLKSIGLQPT
jgi:hypothetical protein